METREEREGRPGGRERGKLLAELRATDEPGNQRTPADSPSSLPSSGLALAGNSLVRLRAVVRSGWARPHPREGKRQRGRRMGGGGGREGGSGEAENRRRRDPPRALPTSNSFTADGRLLQSGSSSVQFWTLHHRHPPRGITRIGRGEERSGRTLVPQNKKIAILRNRFLSRSRVNPKSGYLPPRVHASVRPLREKESFSHRPSRLGKSGGGGEGRREDR